MTGRDLLDAMEYISDDLIEEAVSEEAKQSFSPYRWAAVAAGVVVLCVSAFVLREWQHSPEGIALPDEGYDTSANYAAGSPALEESGAAGGADGGGDIEEKAADELPPADVTSGSSKDSAIAEDNAAAEDYVSQKQGNTANVLEAQQELEREEADTANSLIIEDFPPKHPKRDENSDGNSMESIGCYPAPEKGACLWSQPLDSAIAYYEGENAAVSSEGMGYKYHVHIDVFGETDESYRELHLNEYGRTLLSAEYERLLALGYNVSLSEDFWLTGLFTKAELENFQAASEYGYFISLIAEED